MQYYAVLDTNVLISAMLKFQSVPGKIATEALLGKITPLVNKEIIEEYKEVLARPKFKFDSNKVEIFLDGIIDRAIFIDAVPLDEIIPDPKDVVFYEVVMEGRKELGDAFLVTGNIKHFPVKTYVVTPREMLDIIEK